MIRAFSSLASTGMENKTVSELLPKLSIYRGLSHTLSLTIITIIITIIIIMVYCMNFRGQTKALLCGSWPL